MVRKTDKFDEEYYIDRFNKVYIDKPKEAETLYICHKIIRDIFKSKNLKKISIGQFFAEFNQREKKVELYY